MDKITFGLLGSGWRADFYRRVAESLPERFRLSAVWTHSPGRAAELRAAWNVPAFDSLEAFLAHGGFRFAVVCLNRTAAPEYTVRLAERDIPVLAETPPAADLHGLRALWERLGARAARVQVPSSTRSSRCTPQGWRWPGRAGWEASVTCRCRRRTTTMASA